MQVAYHPIYLSHISIYIFLGVEGANRVTETCQKGVSEQLRPSFQHRLKSHKQTLTLLTTFTL